MLIQHGKRCIRGRTPAVHADNGLALFKKCARPGNICNELPERAPGPRSPSYPGRQTGCCGLQPPGVPGAGRAGGPSRHRHGDRTGCTRRPSRPYRPCPGNGGSLRWPPARSSPITKSIPIVPQHPLAAAIRSAMAIISTLQRMIERGYRPGEPEGRLATAPEDLLVGWLSPCPRNRPQYSRRLPGYRRSLPAGCAGRPRYRVLHAAISASDPITAFRHPPAPVPGLDHGGVFPFTA